MPRWKNAMVKIAILGFGVIGSGVAELLTQNAEKIARSAASEVQLKYILDIRSFPESPFANKFVDNFDCIVEDPEVQIIVESIGGIGAAYDYTKRALLAGKSVV